MNKLVSAAMVAGLAMVLTACGGESDSSGRVVSGSSSSNSNSSSSSTGDNTKPQPSVAQCKVQGKKVAIPHEGLCAVTLPEVNGGKESRMKCSMGQITLNGVVIDGMELYGHTFQCTK